MLIMIDILSLFISLCSSPNFQKLLSKSSQKTSKTFIFSVGLSSLGSVVQKFPADSLENAARSGG